MIISKSCSKNQNAIFVMKVLQKKINPHLIEKIAKLVTQKSVSTHVALILININLTVMNFMDNYLFNFENMLQK
jgi:pseudouridine-5'-phosphate glycosidase